MGWFSDFLTRLKPPAIKDPIIIPANQTPLAPSDMPQCGIDIVKSFEKCVLVGYPDQGGIPTDGWGNTFGAKIGVRITQAQADADLVRNLGWAWLAVKKAVNVPLTPNQAGALLSLCYNLGESRFDKQAASLLFMLNSGNYVGVSNKIKQFVWITKDGARQISNGLVNRRKAEAALWVGADWRQV